MTRQDQIPFRNLMLSLAAAYDREIDTPKLDVFFRALKDLSLEQVATAIARAIQEVDFYPSPARLRILAGGQTATSIEDEAELAWYRLRCLSGPCAFRQEALEDPRIKQAFISMGGRREFGTWDYQAQEHWKRQEFKEHYSALARRQTQLTGLNPAASKALLNKLNLKPKTLTDTR